MDKNDIKIYIVKCTEYINIKEFYLELIDNYIKTNNNNTIINRLYRNIHICINDIILYSDIILKYIDTRLNYNDDKLDNFESNFILKYVNKIGYNIELLSIYIKTLYNILL